MFQIYNNIEILLKIMESRRWMIDTSERFGFK